jgi:hypothetical protein
MHLASLASPAHVAVFSDTIEKSFPATCQMNPVRHHLVPLRPASIEALVRSGS